MQRGALLGGVDFFAAEHALDPCRKFSLLGQCPQQSDGFLVDAVLGVIEQQTAELQREFAETRRVVLKHTAHLNRLDRGMVRLERLPGRG